MKAYFERMAFYNRWANAKLYEAVGTLSPTEFAAPRSGFFPSILKTLNHILVGDTAWTGRLDGAGSPGIKALDQILHPEFAALKEARVAMDERIVRVIGGMTPARFTEDLSYRTMAGDQVTTPIEQVLAHLFNHQTHHRGQVHAMLSSTEVAPPPLDLIYYLREQAR